MTSLTNSDNEQISLEECAGDILLNTAEALLNALKIVHSNSEFLSNVLQTKQVIEGYPGIDLTPVINDLDLIHAFTCPKNKNFQDYLDWYAGLVNSLTEEAIEDGGIL